MSVGLPLATKLLRRITTSWCDAGHAAMTNLEPTHSGANFLFNSEVHRKRDRTPGDVAAGQPRMMAVPKSIVSPLFAVSDAARSREAAAEGRDADANVRRFGAGVFEGFLGSSCSVTVARALHSQLGSHRPFHRLTSYDLECHSRLADGAFLSSVVSTAAQDAGGAGHAGDATAAAPFAGANDAGCTGVWFTVDCNASWFDEGGETCRAATDAQSPSSPRVLPADVLVANVGNCRAFAITRRDVSPTVGAQPLPQPQATPTPMFGRAPGRALPSPRDPATPSYRVVPLSVDHRPTRPEERFRIERAGGSIDFATDAIDGNPFHVMSRAFGCFSAKSDQQRSLNQQRIVSEASVVHWQMAPGDVVVLATHSVFETRGDELSAVDAVADVVMDALAAPGGTPELAAAAVNDFALGFGARRATGVTVFVAGAPSRPPHAAIEETVVPGPLYTGAFQRLAGYRTAVLDDLERLGLTLSEWLQLRWRVVGPLLAGRHALVHSAEGAAFPMEARRLASVMLEEEEFFRGGPDGGDDLMIPNFADATPETLARLTAQERAARERTWFDYLARRLVEKSG